MVRRFAVSISLALTCNDLRSVEQLKRNTLYSHQVQCVDIQYSYNVTIHYPLLAPCYDLTASVLTDTLSGMTDRIADMLDRMKRPDFQARVAAHIKAERDRTYPTQLAYVRRKMRDDPAFRLSRNLRQRLKLALRSKGIKNPGAHRKLIGCDEHQLRAHLERQFKKGMTWANMGKWHVDHILPCSSFDLSDPAQSARCFHFSNLRPLWAAENYAKGNRIPVCQPELTLCH